MDQFFGVRSTLLQGACSSTECINGSATFISLFHELDSAQAKGLSSVVMLKK